MLVKQSKCFHTTLPYSAYAVQTLASTFLVLAGECVTLQCDSRPSLQQLQCVRRSHAWCLHIIHCFYIILTLSCKMTWTFCLSISQCSASVLHALLYESHQTGAHTTRCNWVESVWCNAEMVGQTGDSTTKGDEENPDPLPQRWAGYPEPFI